MVQFTVRNIFVNVFNTDDAYYFDICHCVGDVSFCRIYFGELQFWKSGVVFVRISQYMSGASDLSHVTWFIY